MIAVTGTNGKTSVSTFVRSNSGIGKCGGALWLRDPCTDPGVEGAGQRVLGPYRHRTRLEPSITTHRIWQRPRQRQKINHRPGARRCEASSSAGST